MQPTDSLNLWSFEVYRWFSHILIEFAAEGGPVTVIVAISFISEKQVSVFFSACSVCALHAS